MFDNQVVGIVEELKKSLHNSQSDEQLVEKLEMLWREQHRLTMDEHERFRAVVDNVIDGIITIDYKGSIQTFNKAAENLFGYELEEVMGYNIKMLMPEPYHSEHDGYLENFIRSGVAKIIGIGREVVGKRKDGSTFPLYLAVTQIHESETPIFIGMVRDLTEQKHLEQLKNEFVSTVSHELRTPLTSIRGSLSLIESGVMGEVGAKILPLVKIALNNSERLILLINDILDMEKIESGKMHFELQQLELSTLIEEAVVANGGYAKEHEVNLHFKKSDEPIIVFVDANRIQQVLSNLISNAVKHSSKNETVELTITLKKRLVRVEVKDTGPGIPEEFKKRIFQKFAQADSSDTKQMGGTGLGLNISKTIIEKFGGTVGFNSPQGEGATFFFELPIVSVFRNETEKLSHERANILIVEDDHDIATLLQLILQQEKINSDIAYNAQEAKLLLQKNKYDAMTLDIILPGQNGLSLLEEIRKDKKFHDLSVVVISVKASIAKEENKEGVLEVINWVNKPIDQKLLLDSINKALSMHKASMPKILHVEDDPDIASLVKTLLKDITEVDLATSKSEALTKLREREYTMILLDMMLPDGSAEEIIKTINRDLTDTPIIMFSAYEIDNALKLQVRKILVKTHTSNRVLVDSIKEILNHST